MRVFRSLFSACILALGIAGQANSQSDVSSSRSTTPPPVRYLDQFIDPAVSPRTDFYGYSVGKWLREHPIPRSENGWGVGAVIQEETYRRLLEISKDTKTARTPNGHDDLISIFVVGDGAATPPSIQHCQEPALLSALPP
jgi:hypothetical protein